MLHAIKQTDRKIHQQTNKQTNKQSIKPTLPPPWCQRSNLSEDDNRGACACCPNVGFLHHLVAIKLSMLVPSLSMQIRFDISITRSVLTQYELYIFRKKSTISVFETCSLNASAGSTSSPPCIVNIYLFFVLFNFFLQFSPTTRKKKTASSK